MLKYSEGDFCPDSKTVKRQTDVHIILDENAGAIPGCVLLFLTLHSDTPVVSSVEAASGPGGACFYTVTLRTSLFSTSMLVCLLVCIRSFAEPFWSTWKIAVIAAAGVVFTCVRCQFLPRQARPGRDSVLLALR